MIDPHSISPHQICSILSSMRLANVRSNQWTFKTSLPKYPYSHKLEQFKYTHTSYKQNSATKKAFAKKSQFKEGSGLTTIISMRTIRKNLSFPHKIDARRELTRLDLTSKHYYHPEMIQSDVFIDPHWQNYIRKKTRPFSTRSPPSF